MDVPTPAWSLIHFDIHPTALHHNSSLLADCNYNFAQFLNLHPATTLSPRLEFCPLAQLSLLLGPHPNFPELAKMVTTGMPYHYKIELSETACATEVRAMLAWGNHKSAKDKPAAVNQLLLKDVSHGFSVPILPSTVPWLLHALVQPFSIAKQTTLTKEGKCTLKYRLTQDLSYSLTGTHISMNSCIDMNCYPKMIYGWCLTQIIHFIIALRAHYPHTCILISKYDYSDAYHCIAHSAEAAIQSITVLGMLGMKQIPGVSRCQQ
jgi:hypothetical protein